MYGVGSQIYLEIQSMILHIYRKILIFNVIRSENVQNVKYGGGLEEIEMRIRAHIHMHVVWW